MHRVNTLKHNELAILGRIFISFEKGMVQYNPITIHLADHNLSGLLYSFFFSF